LENLAPDLGTIAGGELRRLTVTTERDRLPERGDKDFAIRTGAQVAAKFAANVRGQFVVDIGGQLLQYVQAMAFARLMTMGC
jgi:hypothetical protein